MIVCVRAIMSIIEKRAGIRQTEYVAVLREYSGALTSGISRREVESYLRLRGRSSRQMCCIRVPRNAYLDSLKIEKERASRNRTKYQVYVR